uniref:Methyltransferase type 11 n=1 Tax=Rhodopseudomonas palustris (strain BisA53) TaxID=316055 RepID=Q07M63_RHOP5
MKPADPSYWDKLVADYEAQAQPFTSYFAEAALRTLQLDRSTRLLDIATGTGAVALAAARTGAQVTAIDFSAGMVQRVLSHGVPNIEAKQMDGQALDLPDASFDAVLSVFGVMLFPDWRAGLREMARVTRPGGSAVVAVWKDEDGAATNLLLSQVRKALYPDLTPPRPFPGMIELSDPHRLSAAMIDAGFAEPSVAAITHDFQLKLAALDDAHRLFELIPAWNTLNPDQRVAVLGEMRSRAEQGRVGDVLPIPSTARIATARRR